MDKVTFETNIPRELRLQYTEGKLVSSNFGGNQYLFSTDQGPFYVSETVGNILHDQIRKQNVRSGEAVEICRREVEQGRGRKSINWVLTKCCSFGPQPDGSYAVPKLPPMGGHALSDGQAGTGAGTPAPVMAATETQQPCNISNGSKPNGNGNGHANGKAPAICPDGRPRTLLEEALKTVVAAVYAAQEYAQEIGYTMPQFSSEDLRTMANTLVMEGRNNRG